MHVCIVISPSQTTSAKHPDECKPQLAATPLADEPPRLPLLPWLSLEPVVKLALGARPAYVPYSACLSRWLSALASSVSSLG